MGSLQLSYSVKKVKNHEFTSKYWMLKLERFIFYHLLSLLPNTQKAGICINVGTEWVPEWGGRGE